MENNSRRNFLKGMALTGAASLIMPGMESFAMEAKKENKLKLKKGTVILFQGDSITDGNRGRTSDPNHIMGHGYAFSIASRWGAKYPEKRFNFYNRGISGNKINDLADRWQTDALDLKPGILSVLVGINDASSVVFHREPIITVAKYEEEYDKLLSQTKAQFPELIFVLCEPFILPVGKVKENWEAYHADVIQRQAVVRKLANKYDAVFVGLQKVFDEACEKAPADYWIWDGVHPTVAGHELIAQKWIKKVRKRISLHSGKS